MQLFAPVISLYVLALAFIYFDLFAHHALGEASNLER